MKQIQYVEPVVFTDILGEPMLQQKGGKLVPVTQDQFEFFVLRIGEPTFIGERTGLPAIMFAIDARDEIKNQRQLAATRGYWLVEDDRAAAIKRTCAAASFATGIMLSLHPFFASVDQMTDHKPDSDPA